MEQEEEESSGERSQGKMIKIRPENNYIAMHWVITKSYLKEAKGQGSVNSGGEGAGTVTEPSTVSAVFQTRSKLWLRYALNWILQANNSAETRLESKENSESGQS